MESQYPKRITGITIHARYWWTRCDIGWWGTMKIWHWVAQKTTPMSTSVSPKTAELVAFFHLVSEGNVNVKQHEQYICMLICDFITFPGIRNMYVTRFSPDAKSFACVNSNHSILNPFVSCGEFHADIVTNLEHNQHEPVTLNLESSRTRHSPQTGGGCNQTLLTYLKI